MSKLEAETWTCSWKLVVFWFNFQQERVLKGIYSLQPCPMDMAIAVKGPTTNIGDMAMEETVEKEKTAKD